MFKSQKTTWNRAILTFLSPIILLFGFRWFFYEPYVIPSGSMIPTLLIHDHIFVNKWIYGLRIPFTERWLLNWNKPTPGEVVVFRFPKDRETFYVKRIVAMEGDSVEVLEGQIIRNGIPIERKPQTKIPTPAKDQVKENEEEDEYDYFQEVIEGIHFISRSQHINENGQRNIKVVVPPGHFFVVGDNRDESFDSRSWGFVPLNNLIGSVSLIWLSCEQTIATAPFICEPNTIRWSRLFKTIGNK